MKPIEMTHLIYKEHGPEGNLTCLFLDCRRKPKYPDKIHTNTRRTYKHHTKKPKVQTGNQTHNLLSVRQQR